MVIHLLSTSSIFFLSTISFFHRLYLLIPAANLILPPGQLLHSALCTPETIDGTTHSPRPEAGTTMWDRIFNRLIWEITSLIINGLSIFSQDTSEEVTINGTKYVWREAYNRGTAATFNVDLRELLYWACVFYLVLYWTCVIYVFSKMYANHDGEEEEEDEDEDEDERETGELSGGRATKTATGSTPPEGSTGIERGEADHEAGDHAAAQGSSSAPGPMTRGETTQDRLEESANLPSEENLSEEEQQQQGETVSSEKGKGKEKQEEEEATHPPPLQPFDWYSTYNAGSYVDICAEAFTGAVDFPGPH
ncbi:hypothetical protein NHQ30_002893 [Ciborinia camelliae]|nr:hypothetical protein NHQ30_002893 [Ciborinia camelliae]